ncbi:hypothetical protein AB0N61_16545 [Microbacterium sp. NPDC089320]|uniref:hypothetical protein n=1 Tax=Microbacterium sp. NPDC089320 TaxID=3155182 RepID=UPI0034291950
MRELMHQRRGVAVAGGGIVVAVVLTGCAPELSSPVGVWEAVGDDEGALIVNADGTFAADAVSYDLVNDRDSDNDFSGAGTWRLVRGGTEIKLHIIEAERGGFEVEPASFSVAFANGVMRFHDAEETVGIEFRIEESAE